MNKTLSKNPECQPSTGWAMGIVVSIPALMALVFAGHLQADMMSYGYAHLFLDYSHGFARRSLYGALWSFMPFLTAKTAQRIGQLQVLLAVAISYAVFLRHFLAGLRARLLFVFLFGGCAALPHLGLIYAYLDVPLFTLLIVALYCIHAAGERYVISVPLVTLIAIVSLLLHEGWVGMFYPAVIAVMLSRLKNNKASIVILGCHFAAVLAALGWIIAHGNSTLSPEKYYAMAQARTDIKLDKLLFSVIQGGFRSQLNDSISFYFQPGNLALIAITLLTSLPYLLMILGLIRKIAPVTDPSAIASRRWVARSIPFLLASPVLLVIVGFDVMRWVSCACINVSLYAAFQYCFARNREEVRSRIEPLIASDTFLASLLATMVIGPFGVVVGNRITEGLFHLL